MHTLKMAVAIVAITFLPALGMTLGMVLEELDDYDTVSIVDDYPAATPSPAQERDRATAATRLPDLGIEWGWATLTSERACGVAFVKARVILLDPRCEWTTLTTYHEWTHIAEAEYYGGGVPEGLVTGRSPEGDAYEVPMHEVVADCGTILLADRFGDKQGPRSYLQKTGGCPASLFVTAHEIITHAGVDLPALDLAGAGVA